MITIDKRVHNRVHVRKKRVLLLRIVFLDGQ